MTAVSDPSALNRAGYDKVAAQFDAARRGFYGREREYLDAFLAGLPEASAILDLGCGTGRPIAEAVIAGGHRVVGVDQSARLLAIARERLPQGRWVEARIEDFEPDEPFAGAILWDSLFHIPRERHEAILGRLARTLAPEARLMVTVGGSEHPAFTDTMFGETFYYDSHPPERALALLRGLGFQPVIAEFMNPPAGGRDKGRYAIVARRAG